MEFSAISFFRQGGLADGGGIDFEHEEIDTGGSKRPTKIHLHAIDPDSGDRMGTLTYHVPRRKADKILVEHLGTEEAHQGKGVASALMDEIQRRHPATPIDHGDRTDAGKGWWNKYTDGKTVRRGRTMASLTTAADQREWYHGTANEQPTVHFDFNKERSYQDETGVPRYWNSHLGAHFTSEHSVADEVAGEWGHRRGHITHARLGLQNPKRYSTEDAMDEEATKWAEGKGYDLMAHRNNNVLGGYGGLITAHPQAREIAHGFRDHLKAQGHDGIIYGNTIEGPHGHDCAIAFHPGQIHVTGTHGVREPCPPTATPRTASTPVPHNTQPYQHQHDWLPRDHFFAPGEKGLDPRLFDEQRRMHPIVRQHLLSLLNSFWAPKYGDSWQTWARVYLAGSEASHWYGNNDLDILIGIDHEALHHHVDHFTGEPNEVIDEKLTDELRHGLNDDHRMLPGPDGKDTGPWENTWYVNPDSFDIREIKPYAAYDITRDQWAVEPVEVPDGFGPEDLPESTWDVFDALRKLITAIRELPDGVREREGAALYDYLHADRHSAFGPEGSGLYDPANVIFKALNAAPGSPLKQLIQWKHDHDGEVTHVEDQAA